MGGGPWVSVVTVTELSDPAVAMIELDDPGGGAPSADVWLASLACDRLMRR